MKTAFVVGERPNDMKVAPILKAIRERSGDALEAILMHTGQHHDPAISDDFFRELRMPRPDEMLGVGSDRKPTAKIMALFDDVCERRSPGAVVVGDVWDGRSERRIVDPLMEL